MDAGFGIAAILVGLACCFYGYPLFRILLILSGLVYGYMLGHLWLPANHPGFSLVIGVAAGVVLAVLAYPLWGIGVFLVGAALGLTILLSLGIALNASQMVLVFLGIFGAVAVGFIAFFSNLFPVRPWWSSGSVGTSPLWPLGAGGPTCRTW